MGQLGPPDRIDVLIPNLSLIFLPGALSASGYLFMLARMERDRGGHQYSSRIPGRI